LSDVLKTFLFRWIKHNPSERHKFIYQLLLSIRWIGLTTEFVQNFVRSNTYVQFCKDARFVSNFGLELFLLVII